MPSQSKIPARYLLFARFPDGRLARWDFEAAQEAILARAATSGFSLEVAAHFAQVAIVGGPAGVGLTEEAWLRNQGCQVKRLWGGPAEDTPQATAQAVRAWAGVAPGQARLPVTGKGLWIWYTDRELAQSHGLSSALVAEGGDLPAIARRARGAGLSHLFVKCGEYGYWLQWEPALDYLKKAGFRVLGWSYCRGDDPAQEAESAIRAAKAGADGHVFDVEAEFEGKARAATELGARVRDALGPDYFLGYAPLPIIDFHLNLPYLQFNRFCQGVLPQFYWKALGRFGSLDFLFGQWEKWGQRWREAEEPLPQLFPIGQAYGGVDAAEIAAFVTACRERGILGFSLWEWAQMGPEAWEAIAQLD